MATRFHTAVATTLALAIGLAVGIPSSVAQRQEPAPEALEQVGVDEKLGTTLPLDLTFRDSRGREVRLRDFFGERPVLLSLTYSSCPMLCQLQLDGLVTSLQDIDWSPGEEFDVVNVSIDPEETWQRAQLTKRKHVQAYGRPGTAAGWHFLTGDEPDIQRLADAVGFRYAYVPERNEYAHAACIFVCTPEGRVSRYLYGVVYIPQTVRLSLVEAADGQLGSAVDQILLFCFHYDAASGRYAPLAFRIMQLGGLLTLTTLLIGLVPYWLRRGRNRREIRPEDAVREGGARVSEPTAEPRDSRVSEMV